MGFGGLGGLGVLADTEDRAVYRDEVHYRARAFGPDARPLTLLIVNISVRGLMARSDTSYQPGERMRILLPVAGTTVAEIRWSLGGRVGCQFEQSIGRATYFELLADLFRRQKN